MYLSLKSLLLNSRHLFIKDKRKRKLSLTHFQNKFWGYVVCIDDDDDGDCSTVVAGIIVPTSFKSNHSCLKFIQSSAGYFRFVDIVGIKLKTKKDY
ncbi:hypothetical protein HanLR1_Chr03g0078621 [Helianthus annuus]|nr:hypothetical protein HanHA89_Chr03g0085101 [Helianthus annuus]KAJ0766529.1 hypothetical protein HanLR1_Chr03g0078621 [Helianthus annuus]